MATRFYLPSSGAAAVSPAFDAEWERTADADRIACVTAKSSTAMTTKTFEESTASAHDVLARQYVSAPLSGAQTITGTVKGQARAAENDLEINARSQLIIRVVSNDGATVRGTLLAADTGALANEWATALTNRFFPRTAGSALTSVAALDGDRIVLEIGTRAHASPLAADQYSIRFGDTGAADLAEDETTTADNVPWIELSQTLTFAGAGISAAVPTAVETDTALTIGRRLTLAVPTAVETDTALAIVATTAPQNTVAPSISGSPAQGQTLTSTEGTWINGPTSFAYQWQRAPAAGGPWTNIAGATTSSYLLAAADVAQHLRCQVTGSNTAGSATASSNVLGPVTAKPNLAALPPRLFIETEWNLDPTATAGTENWRRITHLLRDFTIVQGRSGFLSRMETGRFSGRFDNTDRRFETGYAGTIRNLITNPSLETNANGWTDLGGAAGFSETGAFLVGTRSWRVQRSVGNLAAGDGVRIVNADTSRVPVTAAQPYTASAYAASQNGAALTMKIQLLEYDAGGVLIATTDGPTTAVAFTSTGGKTRLSVSATLQATAATVAVQAVVVANPGNYSTAQVDAVQVEAGSVTDYVDGDQDNGRWEGTAHASRSFFGGPYHPNVRPMRRIRVITARGNSVEDSSLETVPRTGADDPALPDAWRQTFGSVTRVTTPAPFAGSYCYRGEKLDTNGADFETASRYRIPVDPGEKVVLSAHLRKPAGGANPQARLIISFYNPGGAFISSGGGSSLDPPDTTWQRYDTGVVTVPPGAALMGVRIAPVLSGSGAPAVGTVAYVDAVQIDYNALTPYAQGQGPRTLYRGFMQRFPQHSPGRRRGEVVIDAVDAMAVLAADEYSGSPPSEGSNARITRLLDDLTWPAALRKLDAGTQTLAAATNLKTPHLTHAHEVAETELGLFYVDGPGYAVFHDKNHRTTDPRSTASQATFGDGGGSELPYLPTILPDQDVQDVVNRVKATSSAATPVEQIAADTTSRNQHWTRTKSYKTLHSTDAAALTWAQAVLAKLKDPPLEIERLEVDPARDERLWPVALNLTISDRITVNRRPQGTELKTFVAFIESVSYRCMIEDTRIVWVVGWGLSPA